MILHRTEGIVLAAIKYGDYDQIITVFAKEMGVVKIFIKGGLSLRRKMRSPLSPLTRADFLFSSGRGDLHMSKEVVPLERYPSDQGTYVQLQAACSMAEAVQLSQPLEKPATDLYKLFQIYLSAIPLSNNSDTWYCSFLLKILKYDGLLGDFTHCSACHSPNDVAYCLGGESFCKAHAPPSAVTLQRDEIELLERITQTRSLAELRSISIPDNLTGKVKLLFRQSLR